MINWRQTDIEAAKMLKKVRLIENVHTRIKNLSVGKQQLVEVAKAMAKDVKLLILDEPTSAMDPVFRRKFWEIVKQCHKRDGLTVLVITHYMEELVECDNFVCLANGKASFDGSLSEYKKDGMLNVEQILNKYTMKE